MRTLWRHLKCWFVGHVVPLESLATEAEGDAEGNGRVIRAKCARCGRVFRAPYGLAMGVPFVRQREIDEGIVRL